MILGNLTREKLLKVFAMLIMSDGTIHSNDYGNPSQIRLTTTSKPQHEYFKYLCCELFSKKPSFKVIFRKTPYNRKKTKFYFSILYSRESCDEMLNLSPTYKTTPGRKTSTQEYLNLVQPTLDFLLKESSSLKWMAIGTLFDFDGSIIPSFRVKNKKEVKKGKTYAYYQILFHCGIHFAETNPNLIKDLSLLFNSLEIKVMILKNKRNWSGLDGVQIYRRGEILKFLNNCGPMTDVKISSKSKNFKGYTKQSLCKGIKELLEKGNLKFSYHFKNKEEALVKCKELNHKMVKIIRRYQSPMV